MHTQISIQVNADPVKALECAYDTLVSMCTKRVREKLTYIDKSILLASVSGKFSLPVVGSQWALCIISIEKFDDSASRLTITADRIAPLQGADTQDVTEIIAQFFKRFGENLPAKLDE